MFTGLVDDVGTITAVTVTDAGRELTIGCSYGTLEDGESISVNGACLTVRSHQPGSFTVAAVGSTLERTTIGEWQAGRRVNLERALQLGDRLGGHIVQGHVDEVGTVRSLSRSEDAVLVDVDISPDLAALLVPLGSVTVDGVSLTVNALRAAGLELSLIEYTLHHTVLGELAVGDRVHVEGDVIGKYVRRLVAPYMAAAADTR